MITNPTINLLKKRGIHNNFSIKAQVELDLKKTMATTPKAVLLEKELLFLLPPSTAMVAKL